MTKLITIRSKHHWHLNTKLELYIENDNLIRKKWYYTNIKNNKSIFDNEKFSLGVFRFPNMEKMSNDSDLIEYSHDNENKIDLFINEFKDIFSLFGCPDNLIISNGTIDEVYQYIYDIKLPENFRYIYEEYCEKCDCLCDKIHICETLEPILKGIGIHYKKNPFLFEYPDSFWLYIDNILSSKLEYYCNCKSDNDIFKNDDSLTYIKFYYYR